MGIVFSEEEVIESDKDTDKDTDAATIMESDSDSDSELQIPPRSPIVPPRNTVGYTNLAEKLKQLREEMLIEEYDVVDETKEVEEEIISANI